MHIETIAAKAAFRVFIRVFHIVRCERLRDNTKLTLHKALIRSKVTYLPGPGFRGACKTKFSAPMVTLQGASPTRQLHLAFKISHEYDIITKLCRQQAEIIQIKKM
jgi:hypothetical protein